MRLLNVLRSVAELPGRAADVCVAAIALAAAAAAQASAPSSEGPVTIGDGKYRITVEHQSEEELTDEALHQASFLTSRLVLHLNRAAEALADGRDQEADKELELAQKLFDVARDLLPVTETTTVVRDADGNEVYRHVDRVQNDLIPLYEGTIAVEVMQPVLEAKQDEAALHGIQLADADLIYTSVLADLSYLGRKLQSAREALSDEPEVAAANLLLAQAKGVRLDYRAEDDPLWEAQAALQVAKRMAEMGRTEAARSNLRVAANQVALYAGLLDPSQAREIGSLADEIRTLEVGSENAADEVDRLWHRLVDQFRAVPGQAQSGASGERPQAAEAGAPAGRGIGG